MSDEKPANTVKVSLPVGAPTDNGLWPKTSLGPFRYAVVSGIALEYKDGGWFDENGQEFTLSLTPPEKAAHRP